MGGPVWGLRQWCVLLTKPSSNNNNNTQEVNTYFWGFRIQRRRQRLKCEAKHFKRIVWRFGMVDDFFFALLIKIGTLVNAVCIAADYICRQNDSETSKLCEIGFSWFEVIWLFSNWWLSPANQHCWPNEFEFKSCMLSRALKLWYSCSIFIYEV